MSELDLDAIERRGFALTYALDHDHIGTVSSFGYTIAREDVPALVAEVRQLREELADYRRPGRVWVDAKPGDVISLRTGDRRE